MRSLGLIGGLGPGATIHYYRELSKLQAGELLIVQADRHLVYHYVEQGDVTGLATYFARLIERLAKGGAEIAAIPAVTPHICIRELAPISPLPLVNVIEETDRAIRTRGYKRIALFGTRFVIESRMFGMLHDVEIVTPDQVQEIHDAYMLAVDGSTAGRAVFERIAPTLPVDAIVLAGTDLALLFDETNASFPNLDCTQIHIDAILRRL